jgi:uncharacterized membrane protein YhaH (DUF805 family)
MFWYLEVMRKYAKFDGRASRAEYWLYILTLAPFQFVLYFWGQASNIVGIIYVVFLLIHLLPSIAVSVRRLHDTGRSGWYYFLIIIPFFGQIVLFVILALRSDYGENEYGPHPNTFY